MAGQKFIQNKQIDNKQGEGVDPDASDERLEEFSCMELQKLVKFDSLFNRLGDNIYNREDKIKSI